MKEMGVRSDAETGFLLPAFRLRETSPDPVRFPDRHRILQALTSDRANLADRLRPDLPPLPLFLALGRVGWEEEM